MIWDLNFDFGIRMGECTWDLKCGIEVSYWDFGLGIMDFRIGNWDLTVHGIGDYALTLEMIIFIAY